MTPTSIDFGNITVGSSNNQTVTLSNSGSASLTVSRVDVTGAGFSVSGLSLPLTLAAVETTTFSVIFSPANSGNVNGSVSLISDTSTSPTKLSLIGNGVAATSSVVDLTWDPSASANLAGYNVYRANQSGGPYNQSNAFLLGLTMFADGTVLAGQMYFYVVTAVSTTGIESQFSNEAMATVP